MRRVPRSTSFKFQKKQYQRVILTGSMASLSFDESKLEFNPTDLSITAITYGSISDPGQNYDGADFTPVMVKIEIQRRRIRA